MSVTVDDRDLLRAFKKGGLSRADMLDLEKPGALTIINKQKQLVPVDTGATKTSIRAYIQSSSPVIVEDHIGPGTTYSPSIEFGVPSKPNYPIQPFVRPSVNGNENPIINVIQTAFKSLLRTKYG